MNIRNMFLFYFVLALFTLEGCKYTDQKEATTKINKSTNNQFATKFDLITNGNYKILTIYNPLQNSKGYLFKYLLADNRNNIPDSLSNYEFIQTPVNKVVCLSTTHIGFIDVLEESNSIVALANSKLVNNEKIVELINTGKIEDIGSDQNLNYEILVQLQPDIIFAYGVGIESLEYFEKLKELGIKVVLIAEYLEENPLAKLEWLKAIAAFYNKDKMAGDIINKVSFDYSTYCKLTSDIVKKPGVITGLPWKGSWYIPGGNSYLSKLISDAGGSYLWNDLQSTESIPMDFESVYVKSQQAEIWINPGAANTFTDIFSVDDRIADFDLIGKGKIYNNNAIQNSLGGNDYWESGIVNPDVILKDLIKIFHPELLPDYKLHYYKKLN